ncbi:uncharacterized protein LOC116135829 [Pistacia vera]|uniref:uncharacterized protein LOC116135829 n=1 Tax=Pistacia vera TaxID=55513 RepID=UPI001263614E|nr:uncharacterized protein LOC116135829 [Pistacia vera]
MGDPINADSWMDQLEQVFGMMECTDDQKLRFATFLLKGRARHWWRSDVKQSEFIRLTQGNMSMEEYLIKFIKLSRFAPLIVRNERAKCKRFEEGLRGSIRTIVASHCCTEFGKLTEIAMRTESNLGEFDKREPQRAKRSNREWVVDGPSNRNKKREGSFSGTSGSPGQDQRQVWGQLSVGSDNWNRRFQDSRQLSFGSSGDQRVQCNECGRFHSGQCRGRSSGCYHCGQSGHLKRNCPILTQGGSVTQRPV